MSAHPLTSECRQLLIYRCFHEYTQKGFSNLLEKLHLLCRLIKYEHEGYAKIGIMPRYGDADSVKWFDVEPNCTFHIINCFEDGDEV